MENSITWYVAIRALVQWKTNILPLAVVELPTCDEREQFWDTLVSMVNRDPERLTHELPEKDRR